MPEFVAWLIFLLPLTSFVLISLIIRPFFNQISKLAGYITILSIFVSMIISFWGLSFVNSHGGVEWAPHSWIDVGNLQITIGILMDPITAIMLVVITSVSLMIQIYSQEYMNQDNGYARYFAFMSLFTASMIGLVLARNIVQLFIFWELVGVCSYLLIGFWYHRPAAVAAAKKAFIITRFGDFGFLLAIMYLYSHIDAFKIHGLNPLEIPDIHHAVAIGGILGSTAVMWIALGIFAGAVGKSAQFPLHTWLPDAMEGPTPVSALIHAATMVTAGVFLVARFFPIFSLSPIAMNTVAITGGISVIFAASLAIVATDIKRVMAYSTISQLGYMMLALGVGAYGAAIFHLFTHAFFKALLFLGSGSVSHATGTFNMKFMGGLKRYMPWTYVTFLIASFCLAGIFPFSGFWSKDEILVALWAGEFTANPAISKFLFWIALIGVFMTAFYIFRAIILTFHGEFKGGIEAEQAIKKPENKVHLAESPKVMIMPMIVLAATAFLVGFIVNAPTSLGILHTHWFGELLGTSIVGQGHDDLSNNIVHHSFNFTMAIVSNLIALAGFALAYMLYKSKTFSVESLSQKLNSIGKILVRKFFFDEIYEEIIVKIIFYKYLAGGLDWLDRALIDKLVNNIAWFIRNIGRPLLKIQNGQLQFYALVMPMGIFILFGLFIVWR